MVACWNLKLTHLKTQLFLFQLPMCSLLRLYIEFGAMWSNSVHCVDAVCYLPMARSMVKATVNRPCGMVRGEVFVELV